MIKENESRQLCEQILKRSASNPAEVVLLCEEEALTRFANNAIHQNMAERDLKIFVRLSSGKRSGTASTNRNDATALDEVVDRARAYAEASPEDPDYPGLAEPSPSPPVAAFDQPTADCSPERRARQIAEVCRLANEKGLNASGAFSTSQGEVVVANSQGLFAYFAYTTADFQTVVMGEDASGHAHDSSWKVVDIPVEALGREAIGKAERGLNPRPLEPGEYEVVFDPYVTLDLLNLLNMSGMGAQAVLDGRSWMNNRLGEKLMSPVVSIWDDGADLRGLPLPFDYEGVPRRYVEIVKDGVVQGAVHDRRTAYKAGAASTGHALSPDQPAMLRSIGPIAQNLFMAPGQASLEEMIRTTHRGLYITRFWYTRLVHPRDCVVTGMTRDGVFLIENGEVAYPVKNLRFTQSYVKALAGVEAVSRETRLLTTLYGSRSARVPALKLSRFSFTGATV